MPHALAEAEAAVILEHKKTKPVGRDATRVSSDVEIEVTEQQLDSCEDLPKSLHDHGGETIIAEGVEEPVFGSSTHMQLKPNDAIADSVAVEIEIAPEVEHQISVMEVHLEAQAGGSGTRLDGDDNESCFCMSVSLVFRMFTSPHHRHIQPIADVHCLHPTRVIAGHLEFIPAAVLNRRRVFWRQWSRQCPCVYRVVRHLSRLV